MNAQVGHLLTVSDIIKEYQQKDAALSAQIKSYEEATAKLRVNSLVMGCFFEAPFKENYIYESSVRSALLKSAWKAVYMRLNIDAIAPSNEIQAFNSAVSVNPPPLTAENIMDTLGDYIKRHRFHILRGFIEIFSNLDKYYKSHSRIKVGVEGLPKRIILRNLNRLDEIVRAMRTYKGMKIKDHREQRLIMACKYNQRNFRLPLLGLTIKRFKNGNAHVHFNKKALDVVNSAIAAWYGEALGNDAYEDTAKPQSKDVAKDLQFYRTPKEAGQSLVRYADLRNDDIVLEPSCGDGALMDLMRNNKVLGYEVSPERVHLSRMKGHTVIQANFLEVEPSPMFDKVVMNPPFYGKHYQKHLNHALKFLKPRGVLTSILPASARYEHKFQFEEKGVNVTWIDLPTGSFSESGTNISTVIIRAIRNWN